MQKIRKRLLNFLYLLIFVSSNFIQDGNFQQQHPLATQTIFSIPPNNLPSWYGKFELCSYDYYSPSIGTGQYVNLNPNGAGYLSQDIQFTEVIDFQLSFDCMSTITFAENTIQIFWNSQSLNEVTITGNIERISINISSIIGTNTLRVQNSGKNSKEKNIFLDNFSLEEIALDSNQTSVDNSSQLITNETTNLTQANPSLNLQNSTTVVQNISINTEQENNTLNNSQTNTSNISEIDNGLSDIIDVAPINSNIFGNNRTTPDNSQEIQIVKDAFSSLLAIPVSQIPGLKYIGLLIDDLLLYLYDNRQYNGTAKGVFISINDIEREKFAITKQILNLSNFNETLLPLSDYSKFSHEKHYQVDETSDNFLQNSFNYFLFNIPETFIICLFFHFLFRFLFNYKISVYLRRFYFIQITLLQTLFQANVSYFTFLGLLQIHCIFSFKYTDRFCNAFGILFLGLVIIFSFGFYVIANSFLGKQFGYFIYYFYRTFPSLLFLTMKMTVRAVLLGFVHYFFHEYYGIEILVLSVIQLFIILLCVCMETYYQIFVAKIFYVLTLLFHFQIILLNLSFYLEETYKMSDGQVARLLLDIQGLIILLHLSLTVILILIDFVPLQYLHVKKEKPPQKKSTEKKTKKSQIPLPQMSMRQKRELLNLQDLKTKQQQTLQNLMLKTFNLEQINESFEPSHKVNHPKTKIFHKNLNSRFYSTQKDNPNRSKYHEIYFEDI